jgi:hypothetical protein
MTTKQIRVVSDCITILDAWRHEGESYTDAIRRMDPMPEPVEVLD